MIFWLALGFGAVIGVVLGVFIGFSLFQRAGTWD
jgi:hypothetical protein